MIFNRIARASFLAIVVALPTNAAFAQAIGDNSCKQQTFISSEAGKIQSIFKKVVDLVETVPPDEAEYIRKESKLALEQQNRARFAAVGSRRFFLALKFHDDAKIVSDNIAAARKGTAREAAIYLVVALSRLADAHGALSDFTDGDQKRPNPTLSQSNRETMFFNLPLAKGMTVNLLQCIISVL